MGRPTGGADYGITAYVVRPALSLLLWLASLSVAHAQSFPVPVTPARPVSGGVLTRAAGFQTTPRLATNGEMTFVAWDDQREGGYAVYGTRLDAEGNVLDPAGVRIGNYLVRAVAWNGESFVVVMENQIAFVSPDLTITTRSLGLPSTYRFAAATSVSGPDVRFLFVSAPGDQPAVAAIFDGRGELIATKTIGSGTGFWIAGGTNDGFLVIRNRFSARLDRDGNVLSHLASSLPIFGGVSNEVVAGGDDGFLVLHNDFTRGDLTGYRLDPSGVFNGRSVTLSKPAQAAPLKGYQASMVREGNRYLIVWHATQGSDHSYQTLADVGSDDAVVVRRFEEWFGGGHGIAITSNAGRRIMATSASRTGFTSGADILVRALPDPQTPGAAHTVSSSLTRQTNVSIAAGSNGYAVVWSEEGPDVSHAYVRRFSATGTPLDEAPISIFSVPSNSFMPTATSLVSNGETYLLGWETHGGAVFRRLAADSGAWIDVQPVPLGMLYGAVRFASNGADALALGYGSSCGGCLLARRFAMSGAPLTSPVVNIRTPPAGYEIDEARVESNGSDFLAVWTETQSCLFPCSGNPQQVYATRLRADGTVIDSAPLQLEVGNRSAYGLTIASSDSRYFVGWSERAGLRGTRVTAEGAVLDRGPDGGGVLLAAAPSGFHWMTSYASTLQKRFVLLIRHDIDDTAAHVTSSYVEGLTFTADTELKNVIALPRTVVFGTADRLKLSFSMAAKGSMLAVAYDAAPPATAGVPRAFIRLFGEPARRRSAAH
jgi:hypothetical protein